MIDQNKAFEVEHGLDVYDPNSGNQISGPFYTGGPSNPIGLNLAEETIYVQNKSDGIVIWRKFGNGINDWTIYDGSIRSDDLDHDLNVPINTVKLLSGRKVNGCIKLDGRITII